jgi:hypothetical protein
VEILLLIVAVVAWVLVRRMDRAEMFRQLELQRRDIGRLERDLAALRRVVLPDERPIPVVTAAAVSVPVEAVAPVAPVVPVAPPPPPPVVVASVASVESVVLVSEASQAVPVEADVVRFVQPKEPVDNVPVAASVAADAVTREAVPAAYAPMFRSVEAPVSEAAGSSKQSLELTLGVNWLNRLAIVLLVIGVAGGLYWEVTHLGPVGKLLTAYGICAVLLGGGLWLERKPQYRVFARAGIGGGWALTFLTTYAMYFFPATQVLSSQAVDLVLLFGVGVGMVWHSLRYRSQVVTGLAFLLAFSTVTISQVTAFSLLASAVLALGLEVVCVREAWYGLELAGVLAAYGNHFLWLDRVLGQSGGPGHVFPHWGESTGLLLLFWAIFRVGYCVRKPADATAEGMSGLVAVVNSAGVLALMKYQSFHPEWGFRALLALGAVEMVLAFVMRGRRRPAFTVLVTIASVLLVAAIPLRFGGATWPVLWVLQGEALFLCGLWLKERVLRWLGVIAHLLVVGQLVLMHGGVVLVDRTPELWKIAVAFFCVAAAMWVNAEWLGRAEDADEHKDVDAFGAALRVSSFAAAACAALGIWILVPGWTLALLWALLALVLVEVGLRASSLGLRLQGYGVLAAALVRLTAVNFAETRVRGWDDVRLWAGAGLVAACVLLYERLRRAGESALDEERAQVAGGIMWCASGVAAWVLYLEVPEKWLAVGWVVLALVLVEYGLRVGSRGLRVQGYLAVAGALGWLGFVNFISTATAGFRDARLWAGVGVVAACVLLHERLRRSERVSAEERTGVAGAAMWCASGVAAWVLYLELPERWLAVGWAVLALVLVEYGVRVRSLSVRLQAYGSLAGSLCWLVMVNFTAAGKAGWGDPRLWAGLVVVEACVLVHERLVRAGEIVLAEERTGVAGAVMWCASALVTGLFYLELPERWLAAGWAGFALVLAGFALVRDGARIRRKALLLALLAAGRGIFVNLGSAGDWWWSSGTSTAGVGTMPADWGRLAFFVAVGLLMVAIPVGFMLRRRELAGGGGVLGAVLRRPEQVFFFAALAMLFAWMPVDFHQGSLTMAWSGLGVAVFLVALAVGERSFRLSGLVLLLFGVAKLLAVDVWGLPSVQRYLLLIGVGVALLLVSFLYSRFGDRLKEYL